MFLRSWPTAWTSFPASSKKRPRSSAFPPGAPPATRLGPWKVPALLLFAGVLGCSIVLPYGVLLRTAFVRNWSAPMGLENLTFDNWRFVFFEFSQTRLALQNTFILGLSAATAGTLLVTVIAYLSVRRLVWGHRYLSFLAMAPVAIPGIVLAVGLFLSYTHPPLLLYGPPAVIFLAYVPQAIPAAS